MPWGFFGKLGDTLRQDTLENLKLRSARVVNEVYAALELRHYDLRFERLRALLLTGPMNERLAATVTVITVLAAQTPLPPARAALPPQPPPQPLRQAQEEAA
jgi:hypothetical protein